MKKMPTDNSKGKKSRPKSKLGIPDLEHSKAAVLRSLGSPDSRRGYQHAIDEFVAWYCSEPRLAFNKTVVLRYRFHLAERGLAPGTINVRMAAVRRLAFEAADSGLLSPELAAGIHRVKGVRKLGSRLGNWLTAGEASALWQLPDGQTLTGKRNRAILAILLGCGLRRRELAELTLESIQRREERWAIVDLVGKGRHIRTVPVPAWVKETLDAWLAAAEIGSGSLFRCVCRADEVWGRGISEKTVWHVVKKTATSMKIPQLTT
jgi:site-specific recombinase XerD